MENYFLIAIMASILGSFMGGIYVKVKETERLQIVKADRAKLRRECRSLRWQLCYMAMTFYAKRLEKRSKKFYMDCLEFRNECAIKITGERVTEVEMKEFIDKWTLNHELWRKCLRTIKEGEQEEEHQKRIDALESDYKLVKKLLDDLWLGN